MIRELIVLLTFLVIPALQAEAGSLVLNQSGSFGPTTTLAGDALGTETTYSFQAVFDTSTGVSLGAGQALYDISSLSIRLGSLGVFTGAPAADVHVLLGDPSNGFAYFAGITDAGVNFGIAPFYADASPAFLVAFPTPTAFSGLIDPDAVVPFTIELSGVASPLIINDLGATPIVTSISAVPEPSSIVLCGIAAIVGMGAACLCRKCGF